MSFHSFLANRTIKWKNSTVLKSKISAVITPCNFQSTTTKPIPWAYKAKTISPFGWFLLLIPASSFSLGVWQIQRKKWKENLISNLQSRTSSNPVPLPENLEDVNKLEYKPVHVKGYFLHNQELYMGPRSLLTNGDSSTPSSFMTGRGNKGHGYWVITPFKLEDRDATILINRGWVPVKYKDPKTRQKGQPDGLVDVIGLVRLHENRPQFSPKNQGDKNYFFRDLEQMSASTGALPVFLDATTDFDVPEGPIGGQTRISLRNEHLSYILTWFTLCGATSFMWYKKFLK